MIDDETLMAYVDGELDPTQRAEVEAAAASSADVAQRLEAHQALRAKMANAFSGVLAEPPPPALVARIAAAGEAAEPGATVVDFAAHVRRRRPVAPAWMMGAGMAACLALGVFAGLGTQALRASPPIVSQDGAMVAHGALAQALETQLASDQHAPQPVRIGLSVRTGDGRYCRTFRLDGTSTIAGLACRGSKLWTVQMAMSTGATKPAAAYRTAATDTPAAILEAVEALAAGPALDASAEAAAKNSHWRPD